MIDFEDTSGEVQFADAIESILQSDSNDKNKTFVKTEMKQEEKFNPSASATASTMSVGHTPTTQAGAIRRPPPPPGGSRRGLSLPPQVGAICGNPPPGSNQQGNNPQKGNATGLPSTLESTRRQTPNFKQILENAVDQEAAMQRFQKPLSLRQTSKRPQTVVAGVEALAVVEGGQPNASQSDATEFKSR